MVWCAVVWCGVLWCAVVCCGVLWCAVVCDGVLWWGVLWCAVVCCGVVCDGVHSPHTVLVDLPLSVPVDILLEQCLHRPIFERCKEVCTLCVCLLWVTCNGCLPYV